MNNEVRSDLIGAWLAYTWYKDNAPERIGDWTVEINEPTRMVCSRMVQLWPGFNYAFVTQGPVAKTAIEKWNLTDVALIGGGTPTPFHPRPDQLLYYTDLHPNAVAEAERQGYRAVQVDARNPQDMAKLVGAKTAIATGLMHLLPDPAVTATFGAFENAGFESVILNNARPLLAHEVEGVEVWSKGSGLRLYPRTPDDIATLLPPNWRMTDGLTMHEFYEGVEPFESLFAPIYNYFFVVRAERVG